MEYSSKGEEERLDYEDSGKDFKTFGAKRPRLAV